MRIKQIRKRNDEDSLQLYHDIEKLTEPKKNYLQWYPATFEIKHFHFFRATSFRYQGSLRFGSRKYTSFNGSLQILSCESPVDINIEVEVEKLRTIEDILEVYSIVKSKFTEYKFSKVPDKILVWYWKNSIKRQGKTLGMKKFPLIIIVSKINYLWHH